MLIFAKKESVSQYFWQFKLMLLDKVSAMPEEAVVLLGKQIWENVFPQ